MDENFTTETWTTTVYIYIEKYRVVLTFAIYDIDLHFFRNPDNFFGITEEKNTSSKSFSPTHQIKTNVTTFKEWYSFYLSMK